MESIFQRRSIRNFKSEDVSDSDIKKLLSAAMCAPSAHNRQPWHFIIVKNKQILLDITKVHPYTGMLKTASAAIIVCGGSDESLPIAYWPQDCAAATENILISAQEMGLGTCWCGVFPHQARIDPLRKLFNIPEGIYPFNVIALGFPDETKPPNDRYSEQKVHFEKW